MMQRLAKLSPSLLACGVLFSAACTTREINIRELRVELMDPYAPAAALVVGQVAVPANLGGALTARVNFGDGSDAVDVKLDSEGHFSAAHTFDKVGSWDVLVEAKSGSAAKGSASAKAEILKPVGNLQVTCRICDTAGGCQEAADCHVPGPAVTMSVTSEGGFNATRYTWNFGDVTPPRDGPVVTHEYAQSGTYLITVIASDTLSSQMALSKEVVVDGAGVVEVTTTVGFANGGSHAPDDEVDLNITAFGYPPVTLLVTWGDESNNVYPAYPGDGSRFAAKHTYLTQGTYTITTTAVDKLGNQKSKTDHVTVLPPLPSSSSGPASGSGGASSGASSTGGASSTAGSSVGGSSSGGSGSSH